MYNILFLNPRGLINLFRLQLESCEFDGFSYGRKTLFVVSGHLWPSRVLWVLICTRLPTSPLGQTLVNTKQIHVYQLVSLPTIPNPTKS